MSWPNGEIKTHFWLNVVIFLNLVEESSSRQDHGELTGVVGVVEPGLVVDVPGVIPPGEAHDAIPGFTPHSVKTQSRREILIYRSIN